MIQIWQTDSVLSHLLGRWRLDRCVLEHAVMQGAAEFSPRSDGGLDYAEAGSLALVDGSQFDFWRRYVFMPCDLGFNVYFDEVPLRLFHKVALDRIGEDLTGAATHLCMDDTYTSAYRFLSNGSFTIHHHVNGPRKSYRSETVYTMEG